MFRIVAYCEDRKLGDAMRALAGVCITVETPVPVVNAESKGGKISAQSNGNLVHMFIDHLHKAKLPTITPAEAQAWLLQNGKSKLSSSYVLKNAVSRGVLAPKGKGSARSYKVVQPRSKPTAKRKPPAKKPVAQEVK
jgi:hypothetical protein